MPFTIAEPANQIPPGSYTATLEKVEHLTGGRFGEYRKWHWLVQVADEIVSLSTMTSTNTTPNSVSYKYLSALLGREPKTGEELEDPTGSRVVMQLVNNEKGFPKIESLIPYVEPQTVMDGVPR